MSNADYIIDSLCRDLRHLDFNPHVPNVISAILSYVGVANEILPLLEEPVLLFCFKFLRSKLFKILLLLLRFG